LLVDGLPQIAEAETLLNVVTGSALYEEFDETLQFAVTALTGVTPGTEFVTVAASDTDTVVPDGAGPL
jgi:hypothetical protein